MEDPKMLEKTWVLEETFRRFVKMRERIRRELGWSGWRAELDRVKAELRKRRAA